VKKLITILLGATIILITGCSYLSGRDSVTPTGPITLPIPQVFTTHIPPVDEAARTFLNGWKSGDYSIMYTKLSSNSQKAITPEKFLEYYDNVANEAAVIGIDYEIIQNSVIENNANITYHVIIRSAIIGEIQRDIVMDLVLENGQWRIIWNPTLILPELAGGNYLAMDRESQQRATIYDRNGNPLAANTEAVAIGMYPDYIDLNDKSTPGLLSLISNLTGYRVDTLAELIQNAYPGDYIPLGEIAGNKDPRRIKLLSEYNAIIVSQYNSRLYYGNGIGSHVVGYTSAIQKEEISEYRRKGYLNNEKVGRKGLELWGESILTGVRGGTLYVFNPEGKPIAQIGSTPSQPGQDIYSTIDRDLQIGAQKALSIFTGSIVVLERDTGRVLAMVSSPGFDPNAYQTENANWNITLNKILNDPRNPQFNRASQGQYPLGSAFKVVTMAAALESGRYTPETTYNCQYTFEELPGFTRYDWTYDHFLEDGVTKPSGLLTFPQGLIRSCNPFFWHIGLDLYNQGLTTAISGMARAFGLGSLTGIEGVDEETGNAPDPTSQVDAINLAIGQGDLLVTPLQVASFAAALGNGGTLYRPEIIGKVVNIDGTTIYTNTSEVRGVLPIKLETMQVIKDAMIGVVTSEKPRGTAYLAFIGLDIPVAGKTGTAESPLGEPYAWFVGYTMGGREDKPDIAIAVIAENAGEGSEIAAPIFRRIVELYFYGKPLRLYRWEATFDVTRSPTPLITYTPTVPPNFTP
jgi:penicillin-binding protein 2